MASTENGRLVIATDTVLVIPEYSRESSSANWPLVVFTVLLLLGLGATIVNRNKPTPTYLRVLDTTTFGGHWLCRSDPFVFVVWNAAFCDGSKPQSVVGMAYTLICRLVDEKGHVAQVDAHLFGCLCRDLPWYTCWLGSLASTSTYIGTTPRFANSCSDVCAISNKLFFLICLN